MNFHVNVYVNVYKICKRLHLLYLGKQFLGTVEKLYLCSR